LKNFQWNREQHRACERLWKSVIVQAIQDSKRESKKKEAVNARRDAKLWANSRDFLEVCELAGVNSGEMNAEVIRDIILHDHLYTELRYIKVEK
jgi:hypothetical protein